MSTKVLMDVDEYLHTSFEGPDCEYLDGEVVERNMGEIPHGKLQINFGRPLFGFGPYSESWRFPRPAFRSIRAVIASPTSPSGETTTSATQFPRFRRSWQSRYSRLRTG